jgi:hypothetical protein
MRDFALGAASKSVLRRSAIRLPEIHLPSTKVAVPSSELSVFLSKILF